MLDQYAGGGGASSISLGRTSKGDYTWDIKLYFLGNNMQQIRRAVVNICKTRDMLEHILDQKIVPSEETSATLKRLEAEIARATRKEEKAPEEAVDDK
jgi:hypothetical protein